jgi:hypothetical protein
MYSLRDVEINAINASVSRHRAGALPAPWPATELRSRWLSLRSRTKILGGPSFLVA